MRQPGSIAFLAILAIGVLVVLLLPGCGDPKQVDDRPPVHHLTDVATV